MKNIIVIFSLLALLCTASFDAHARKSLAAANAEKRLQHNKPHKINNQMYLHQQHPKLNQIKKGLWQACWVVF